MNSQETFEGLLVKDLPALRRYAQVQTRNWQLADDLVQQTLLTALEKRDEIEKYTDIKGFLFRLMSNLNLSILQTASRREELFQEYTISKEQAQRSAANVMVAQIARHHVQDAVAEMEMLPLEQKQALYLTAFDGCSYEETAEILSCSIGTVKSRVARARARLAAALEGRAERRPGAEECEPTSAQSRP